MSCTNCSNSGGTPAGCGNKGHCASGGCGKMGVFNWLENMQLPTGQKPFDGVEVRFKNGRKLIYKSGGHNNLYTGDVVVVESTHGYDVGVVTLTGELVKTQLARKNMNFDSQEIKKIYRKAKEEDIEKWKEARAMEEKTMHRARTLALAHNLQMKISDVEYQGDKTKATFYYTADERVDFRELIKKMAEEFKIRIEMRQIGARQEAGRLGGIGSCGRELCCSTWLNDFRTVSTSAARYQQLSLNPQKLAGQCGKLKCCLNYELDMYIEAYKHLPETNVRLQTKKGIAVHQKTDIFRKQVWYAYTGEAAGPHVALSTERVKFIIEQNKKNIFPDDLTDYVEAEVKPVKKIDYDNVVGQDSITRFDDTKKKHGKNRNKNFKKGNNQGGNNQNKGGAQNQPQNKGAQNQNPNQNKGNQQQQNKGAQNQNPNQKKGGNNNPNRGPHNQNKGNNQGGNNQNKGGGQNQHNPNKANN
ncbi:MAG TPA: regulatory iron-sulfur-containing complex subunit RicT, partial [Flavobacteriales bacterium]|nr:regulatory iron-sulfur-containing complex subunit RicT [Flavobacteriales bacterium]